MNAPETSRRHAPASDLVRVHCDRCSLEALWTDEPTLFLDRSCLRQRRCEACRESATGLAEQRAHARFLPLREVAVHPTSENSGWLPDLSLSGMAVHGLANPVEGWIHSPALQLGIRRALFRPARVVRCEEETSGWRIGCEFDRPIVQTLLDDLPLRPAA